MKTSLPKPHGQAFGLLFLLILCFPARMAAQADSGSPAPSPVPAIDGIALEPVTVDSKITSLAKLNFDGYPFQGWDDRARLACLLDSGKIAGIFPHLPPEMADEKVSVNCDRSARYWVFSAPTRQVLFDTGKNLTLCSIRTPLMGGQPSRSQALWVDPYGRSLLELRGTSYPVTKYVKLPVPALRPETFVSGDAWKMDKALYGPHGDLAAAVGRLRMIDLDDPDKALHEKGRMNDRGAGYVDSAHLGLLLPGQKKFLGTLHGPDTGFYAYPSCELLRATPSLPMGWYGANTPCDLLVGVGDWSHLNRGLYHTEKVAYCLNTATGKACGFAFASDGGFNYSEPVKLLKVEGRKLAAPPNGQMTIDDSGGVQKNDWVVDQVNLKTLQHGGFNGADPKKTLEWSNDMLDRNGAYPSVVLAAPEDPGVWIGFAGNGYTLLVYVDPQLEVRRVCRLNAALHYYQALYDLPSQKAFGLLDDRGSLSLFRLPKIGAHPAFSYFQPGERFNPAPVTAVFPIQYALLPNENAPLSTYGLARGPDGDFYQLETLYFHTQNQIVRSDPQGNKLNLTVISKDTRNEFKTMAMDTKGDIYLSDGITILAYNPQGELSGRFSPPVPGGKKPSNAPGIREIGVDGQGRVYTLQGRGFINPQLPAGDPLSGKQVFARVAVYDPSWKLLHEFFLNGDWMKVCLDGSFYLFDLQKNALSRYDALGSPQWEWGGYGPWDTEFIHPINMAVDGAGNIYVVDQSPDRIKKFDPQGHCAAKWDGVNKNPNGSYSNLGLLTVDSNGVVWAR